MLRDFEKKAIGLLTFGLFTNADILAISREAELVGVEHTGAGYFLVIRHPSFPQDRHAFDKPILVGEVPGVVVGFCRFY